MTEPAVTLDPHDAQLRRIRDAIIDRYPRSATEKFGLLEQAFRDAEFYHRGQERKSGEPAIIHPYRVALLVAEAGLDVESVIVALLHDVIEDTELTKAEIGERYGEWMAGIVDGLTKASLPLGADARNTASLETYRKLLASTTEDIRTLLVKIFDRLDNMRDLAHLDRERQRRISTETVLVYVPMAQRLGLQDIADELTTLCFRFLYPYRFKTVLKDLKIQIDQERDRANGIKAILESAIEPLRLAEFEVAPKYRQVCDAIYDKRVPEGALHLFHVKVPTAQDCYRALGALNMTCRAVPNSIRDYISNPKPNRYQGLDSQLFVGGEAVRIEITSREMEAVNRRGVLANWQGSYQELSRYYQHYLELLDHLGDDEDLRMEDVLRYAQMETVQAFTPKGERLNLPPGSTVIDFAFAIHTDLGLHCRGGLVDGKKVSRFSELADGAMVEVLAADDIAPHSDWLDHVRTTRAQLAIRHALRDQSLARAEEVGKELFAAELARLGEQPATVMSRPEFKNAIRRKKLSKALFYQQIGTRKLNLRTFLTENDLVARKKIARQESRERSTLRRLLSALFRAPQPEIKVRRANDPFIQMARCCSPLEGDSIAGVQRDHGVVIHRSGCPMLSEVDRSALVNVGWDLHPQKSTYRLTVLAKDHSGVLYRIGKVMHGLNVSIRDMTISREDGSNQASVTIDIDPVSPRTFQKIIGRLRNLKDVKRVH